jgi:beta-mannosidase
MVNGRTKPHHVPEIAPKRPWMRKPQYTFGWNWTWWLATCGISGPAHLAFPAEVELAMPAVLTTSLAEGAATLRCVCTADLRRPLSTAATLAVALFAEEGGGALATFTAAVQIVPGEIELAIDGVFENPELWWPAGMGGQRRYRARFTVEGDDGVMAATETLFGVRRIELEETPRAEPDGWMFRFLVNGEPVFMKGANWVPGDTCPARVTREKRIRRLHLAREANLNYLRVWGGGIYEPDDFYETCDQLGILVWQDFMFSCAEYPDYDPNFVAEVEQEVAYQTKRLRSHPCVLAWCGNNEVEQQKCHVRHLRPRGRYYGETLFNEIIPGIVASHDPSRPYVPSSGIAGTHTSADTSPMEFESGIVHIDIFDDVFRRGPKRIPSFLGEWYTAAPPTPATIEKYLASATRSWQDPVWQMHDFVAAQFAERVDDRIAPLRGVSFEKTLLAFHALQMELLKGGMELCRKHLWTCSGNVIWMLADAYTGFTRTVIDYDDRRKPGFHALRRACAPLLPVAEDLGDCIEVAVVNEHRGPFSGSLTVWNLDFSGHVAYTLKTDVVVPANSAQTCCTIAANDLGPRHRTFLLVSLADAAGVPVADNRIFLEDPVNLAMPLATPEVTTRTVNDGVEVQVVSDCYVRNFRVEHRGGEELSLSDNWIDVFPGCSRCILVSSSLDPAELIFDWENRYWGGEQAVASVRAQQAEDNRAELQLTALNHSPRDSLSFDIRPRLPAPWGDGASVPVVLSQGQTVELDLTLPAQSGAIPVQGELTWEIDGDAFHRRFTTSVAAPYALELTIRPGETTVVFRNTTATSLPALEFVAVAETAGELACIRERFACDAFSSTTLQLAATATVITAEVRACADVLGRALAYAGDDGNPFGPAAQTARIPDAASLVAAHCATPFPPLAAAGYCVGAGDAAVRFALHHSAQALFFDAWGASGDRRIMPIEIAVSIGEGFGYEGVLAMRHGALTETVRRLRGRPVDEKRSVSGILAEADCPPFCPPATIAAAAGDRIIYRHVIQWSSIWCGATPPVDAPVRFAAVFNPPGEAPMRVFGGIHGRKAPSAYGGVSLLPGRPGDALPATDYTCNAPESCVEWFLNSSNNG